MKQRRKKNKEKTAGGAHAVPLQTPRGLVRILEFVRKHTVHFYFVGSLLVSLTAIAFRYKAWLLALGVAVGVMPLIARIPVAKGRLRLMAFTLTVLSVLAFIIIALLDLERSGDPFLPTPFQAATTRAYVNVTHARFDTLKVGEVPKMRWTVMNTGQTPAKTYSFSYRFRFTQKLLPEHVAALNHGPSDSGGVMPAGIPWTQYHDFPNRYLSVADLEAINSGRVTLYFYGVIIYKDVFDMQHFTEFCYYYDPRLFLTKTCSRFVKGT